MTPAARLSAAIEILDQITTGRVHADEAIRAWGKSRRFAGSGDRRAIAERVYTVLRAKPRIAWRMGEETPRALVLGSLAEVDGLASDEIVGLFTGEGHAPAVLSQEEALRVEALSSTPPEAVEAGVPAFVAEALQVRFGDEWLAEAKGLIGQRAPVDLRVNSLRGDAQAAVRLLAVDGVEPEPTPFSALGLRLPPALYADVQHTRAFKTGWIEVQDEASQVAAALALGGLAGPASDLTVIDWCAGGGGKTLALAAATGGRGALIATDVDARRLAALGPRLDRSGADADVRMLPRDYLDTGPPDDLPMADLVFVDAPCSGSGTWRRHPEAAWRLTEEAVARLAALQRRILQAASSRVKRGGRLAYATCSVLPQENEAVAADFAAGAPNFRPVPIAAAAATPGLTGAGRDRFATLAGPLHMLQMTPERTGTDGFFIALFERLS